jgi:hypothetical protein
LDKNQVGDSTDKERNLLELCCSDITITSGSSASSQNINPLKNSYHLPRTIMGQIGLEGYSRYLLIPKRESSETKPYQLLWPKNRSSYDGSNVHWGEAILIMAGLLNSPIVGSTLQGDWELLVNDLVSYCNKQPPITRFSMTKTNRSRSISSEDYMLLSHSFMLSIFDVFRTILNKWLIWIISPYRCSIYPEEKVDAPYGAGPEDNEIEAENPGGFGILTITIKRSNLPS